MNPTPQGNWWKHLLRQLTPPLLWQALHKIKTSMRPHIYCKGVFRTFEDALRASDGYDSPLIVERTLSATRAVLRGEAAYEQDSVLFREPKPPMPVLHAICLGACWAPDADAVLDFGGSLGTTFWRARPYLPPGLVKRWIVVEQPKHVEAAKSLDVEDVLEFTSSLESASAGTSLLCVHASGVIQYLPEPLAMLEKLLQLPAPVFLLGIVATTTQREPVLTVQHVPPEIYPASYPVWFLPEHALEQTFAKHGWIPTLCTHEDYFQPPRGKGRASTYLLTRASLKSR